MSQDISKESKTTTNLIGNRLNLPVALLGIYLLLIFIFTPNFFGTTNLKLVLYYTCLLTPAVLGVHLLMVLGLFDLSVGAIAAVAGIICANCLSEELPIWLSIILALCGGLLFGALNWLLVSKARIPALIGTLITMGVARATALGITHGQVIGNLPTSFGELALGIQGSFPPAIGLGLLLVLGSEILTRRHKLFSRLYHVGSNRTASSNSGINVSFLECFGFLACALGAALVGVLQSSRTLSASPLVFPDLALECIAACVIGGTSLQGGSGRAVGAFLGMLMVVVSRNLVVLAGVSVYWKELAVALVLLLAVLVNKRQTE